MVAVGAMPESNAARAESINRSASAGGRVCDTDVAPLMLSLALESYDRDGADPVDLSKQEEFADRQSMESYLLEQIIPLAYGPQHVERRILVCHRGDPCDQTQSRVCGVRDGAAERPHARDQPFASDAVGAGGNFLAGGRRSAPRTW